MPTTKKADKSLPASPLLNAQPPHAKSTINLNKLDKARFTSLNTAQTGNSNSLRIILYVIVVIIIGVGAALLARQLMINNETQAPTQTDNQNEENMPASATVAYQVDTSAMQDSLATNIPNNSDFKTSSLLSIGSTNVDMTTTSLNSIAYEKYTTFARTIFSLTTSENKLPKTNISYDSAKDTLNVQIADLTNINTDLKVTKQIDDIIQTIEFNNEDNSFTLTFRDSSLYRVFAVQDTLFVDVRTQAKYDQISADETASNNENNSNDETTTDDSTSNNSNSSVPHYNNEFSQDTQYVLSAVNSKSIALNNYYLWDESTFFEFSWAEEGKKGDDYVPNAKAYLVTEDSKNYIMVEIENLTRATLPDGLTAEEAQSKTGINMSNANFVSLKLDSFDQSTGKAVYRIELKRKADFKLLTQLAYGDKTQILSIQIKD